MIPLVLLGIGAGLVSALLLGTVAAGSFFGVLLFWLAPMPLMIVGLGWHWLLAALGALTAGIALDQILNANVAITYMAMIGAPSTALAAIAMQRFRIGKAEAGDLASPGLMLFATVVYAAVVVIVGAMLIDPSLPSLQARLARSTEGLLRLQLGIGATDPLRLPTGQDLSDLPKIYATLVPSVAGATISMTLTVSLWLAALAVRQSGRLMRAWPALDQTRLPKLAGPLAAVAVLLSFAGGYPGFAGNIFVTVLLFAFMMQGFATVHALTRGMTFRGALLLLLWLSVALIGLPGLLLIGIGLIDQAFDLRRRKPGGAGPT